MNVFADLQIAPENLLFELFKNTNMFSKLIKVGLLSAILLIFAHSSLAQEFITAEQIERVLIDERPWTALTADGMRAKIIYKKDNTGIFEGGPFTMSIKWKIEGRELCMTMRFGTKCHSFRQEGSAYQGFILNNIDLTLVR